MKNLSVCLTFTDPSVCLTFSERSQGKIFARGACRAARDVANAVFSTVLKESGRAVLMMGVKNDGIELPSTTQIIEKGNVKPWLYEFGGIVSPTMRISAGSIGMGVNITSPEPDAVVRKMPVLIHINGKIYPSMILENVRLLNGSKRI